MKVILQFNALWIVLVALSGCQSSRIPAWLPPVVAYRATPPVGMSPQYLGTQRTIPIPDVVESPILTAELPSATPPETAVPIHSRFPIVKPFSKPKLLQQPAPPDTLTKQQSTRPTPERMREADTLNAVVHTVGAAFLILAVVFVVAAAGASGWAGLGYTLYGLLSLAISIPFLLFKSSKSTSYIMREEQRAARKANKVR